MGASPLTVYTFPDNGPDGIISGIAKFFNEEWDELQSRYKEVDENAKEEYRERFDGLYFSMW